MTSLVLEEYLSICNARQLKGAAWTPRHQGLLERDHIESSLILSILMNAVCKAFPQEWASLLPAVEYLLDTMPRPPSNLSAFDISTGYAPTSDMDRRLMPFQVPEGLPETGIAAALFTKFKEIYGSWRRLTAENSHQPRESNEC